MAFYILLACIGLIAIGSVALMIRLRRGERGEVGEVDVRRQIEHAERNMQTLRQHGHAIEAHYDRQCGRVVVKLNTGVHLAFPADLVESLRDASADDLGRIEISPAGLGLHWPALDVDAYLPALLTGVFGSNHWMANGVPASEQPSSASESWGTRS